ncbi:MmcB family DNA repair protein [Herbaspirillum sp. WKF16]|uniref:MmcB family DNA repair protein n=1 Tax=Herbaspirillum sp. WKF16 TaxID=3028312 RepID=UPI0023A9F941|nr:MmcB family DNA repair protein [Herbaspirillum sp. WKF16]WDZ97958.1 MmcB family DNA repair protein [Herbaspirillum sp. WKF16]
MKWSHDALAEDLAQHLRGKTERLIWTDMQLGPAGSPRPDVYSVPFSYSRFQPLAYECKVSVADFRADITKGKWTDYLRFACAVIFAVPEGLITKADLPAGCGLIVRSAAGWRTLKGPTMRPLENLPLDAWIKLLIDGLPRQLALLRESNANTYSMNLDIRERLGEQVGQLLRDRDYAFSNFTRETERLQKAGDDAHKAYEKRLAEARKDADAEASQSDSVRCELAQALGLDAGATIWQIRNAAQSAARQLGRDEVIASLRQQLRTIESAVQVAAREVPHIAREIQ